MSRFQTYLGDIAKKAQEIASQKSTRRSIKTKQSKLSQKDIRILKSLKEKAINILPTNKKIDKSFAKLAAFGDTFKFKTEDENYQKSLALEMLTKGKIVGTKKIGYGGGKATGWGNSKTHFTFNQDAASILQNMFMLNYDKMDYKVSNFGKTSESSHLISKEKVLNLLNQKSRQDLLKKYGLNDLGINYIKNIFEDKNLEDKIFSYKYKGKNYFKIGSFDPIMSTILSHSGKDNPHYVEGYSTYLNKYTGFEISDAALYAKQFIADYERKNETFKNILLYSQKEKQLLDKYSNTLAGLSGVDLSGYNKLITDAKKNLDLFYSNIDEYLSKGIKNKVATSTQSPFSLPYKYVAGIDSSQLYKYTGWKKNADNYAALAEKGYKAAFDQLSKILGVSSEQFEITQKTQKETVKQITDILESQNIGKKKEATATSRRNALDIATAKDRPIYETTTTTRKPVFTQRPS